MTEAAETPLQIVQRLKPALAAAAAKVFAASPFVRQVCELDAGLFPGWLESGLFEHGRAPGETARLIAAACADAPDEAALMRALRQTRRRAMERIAFRDLAGLAPLDETLADLSDLADACCACALGFAEKNLQARWGAPRGEDGGTEARPVILGMGKLGGRELNFSSDIDLIFCYTVGGETAGPRSVSNEEYFDRLAQDTARILSARTGDGFVFRVDTMLRPFGSAGAPAWSFDAMESYYQTHGREWERYAFIKARPVAGDIGAGQALLKTLRPFVYRRYLDYNAIISLRELKRMIEDDVRRKGMEDNIKLGAGGIREIEFIVQSFQLVRGGQEAPLRDSRLRVVLRYLAQAGHLSAQTATELDEAYVFLRRVENAIQMYADEQTHALPKSAEARAALCTAMDAADWKELGARLERTRDFVQREFGRVFGEPVALQAGKASGLQNVVDAIWNGFSSAQDSLSALQAQGFTAQTQNLLDALNDLRNARLVRA
ncbi:MAG: bifunctional [glutamate--ammonia ligase]-adenylyl-L-tyrosine phosphorylase/[glutamate--ammonia-ligase] adenylyltransferase, partial [Stenotrophobium sp.]